MGRTPLKFKRKLKDIQLATDYKEQLKRRPQQDLNQFLLKKMDALKVGTKERKATYMRVRRILGKKDEGGLGYANHGNQLLSEAQEAGVLAFVLSLTLRKIPIKPTQIIRLVRDRFVKTPNWKGRGWWTKFSKRHSKVICVGKSMKSITAARINSSSILPENKYWCEEFGNMIEKLNLCASDICNMDETLCKIDSTKRVSNVIHRRFRAQQL